MKHENKIKVSPMINEPDSKIHKKRFWYKLCSGDVGKIPK